MTLRHQLARLPPQAVREFLAGLSADELQALRFDWQTWALAAPSP